MLPGPAETTPRTTHSQPYECKTTFPSIASSFANSKPKRGDGRCSNQCHSRGFEQRLVGRRKEPLAARGRTWSLNKVTPANNLTPINQVSIRSLNLSGIKRSALRTPNLSATIEPDTAHTQNQIQGRSGGGTLARLAAKSSMTRIYAPSPFTPPRDTPQGPAIGFKTPLLPFSKRLDGAPAAQGSVETTGITHSSAPSANSDGVAWNLFRPMPCHPQDETGVGAHGRRPPSHQSFFGGPTQFSFDSVSSNLDDSGYYSCVSEQNENEGDHLVPANRTDALRPPSTVGDEGQGAAARSANPRVAANPDFDVNFANPTKRVRPASPSDEEVVVLGSLSRELPKRPRVRSNSTDSLPQVTTLGNASSGGTQTFMLPPNVPHPMATLGDIPGLKFSGADLERYAELYEKGAERWSRSTMEEWLAGANDIMAKFNEMIDIVSLSSLRT